MAAEIAKPTLDPNDTDLPPSEDTRRAGGSRKANAREKQRANRQLKRQLRRESAAPEQTEKPAAPAGGDRHRPGPVERRMVFFMKMCSWAYPFVHSDTGLRADQGGQELDYPTVHAISQVVEQCWLTQKEGGAGKVGAGGGATPKFHSVEELECFVAAKEKEVAYVEKQLSAMPALQDPAWAAYVTQLDAETPVQVDEALEGPADFLRHTIVPCLRAQVRSLNARVARSKVLEQKHEELKRMCERQRALRARVQSLRQIQAWVMPVCPVWKEIETEIKQAQKDILDPRAWVRLQEQVEKAWLEYQAVLNQACGP